jgi:hypothetical protein
MVRLPRFSALVLLAFAFSATCTSEFELPEGPCGGACAADSDCDTGYACVGTDGCGICLTKTTTPCMGDAQCPMNAMCDVSEGICVLDPVGYGGAGGAGGMGGQQGAGGRGLTDAG